MACQSPPSPGGRAIARELDSARLRLQTAYKERRRADEAVAMERQRIQHLEAQSLADPGHDFGDLTNLLRQIDPEELKRFSPTCVYCRAPMSSHAAINPCPGDAHQCQAVIEEGTTPTAFQQYGRDGWRCGQPGSFNPTGTAWNCTAGHRTDRPCERRPGWGESDCLDGCPCRDLGRKSR
ncbi:hypothetical protein GCM10020000_06160 [Streptomyces olivoverticillatus]